jgi:hypothetical protein
MERLNQPPNTECCSEQGQADPDPEPEGRTNSKKRTQGTSRAVSGIRTPLKQSSLQTVHTGGEALASGEPKSEAAAKGEALEDLSGSKRMAGEERETRATWETRNSPDAPTAGANREGAINDKEKAPRLLRESDRFTVVSGKLAKGPTPPRSLQRKPAP